MAKRIHELSVKILRKTYIKWQKLIEKTKYLVNVRFEYVTDMNGYKPLRKENK